MATLTKTKKNSLSVKERLSALQEQLRHENNSPVTLPDRKEPVEEPINTPPIGISEEKEEDILLEEKNRIKTLPENQKTGIDNLNLPRLPITEEEKKSLSTFLSDAEVKVVWREDSNLDKPPKVGRGKILNDDDNFVYLSGEKGTVIVNKKDIIAVKQLPNE